VAGAPDIEAAPRRLIDVGTQRWEHLFIGNPWENIGKPWEKLWENT